MHSNSLYLIYLFFFLLLEFSPFFCSLFLSTATCLAKKAWFRKISFFFKKCVCIVLKWMDSALLQM